VLAWIVAAVILVLNALLVYQMLGGHV